MPERSHHAPAEPGKPDVPELSDAERETINRELEGFVELVDRETGTLNAKYWEVVRKVHASSDDPLSDPAAKGAYLDLQTLQGEAERVVEEARNAISRVRSETGEDQA